jgi:hypothetical protein
MELSAVFPINSQVLSGVAVFPINSQVLSGVAVFPLNSQVLIGVAVFPLNSQVLSGVAVFPINSQVQRPQHCSRPAQFPIYRNTVPFLWSLHTSRQN